MGVEYRGGNFGGGSLKHLKVKHFEGERLITEWCAIASTYLSVRLQYGIFFFYIFQSLILVPQILVEMEDTALIMATEHTTVRATGHTRAKTARKVSIKKLMLCT